MLGFYVKFSTGRQTLVKQYAPWSFNAGHKKQFLKTLQGKGENAGNHILSFSCNVFYLWMIKPDSLLSANAFNSVQSKFFSFVGRELNPFNNPEQEALWKHSGKRRKCWLPAFSSFPTMFSTLSKTKFNFSVTFILSSANAFSLVQP